MARAIADQLDAYLSSDIEMHSCLRDAIVTDLDLARNILYSRISTQYDLWEPCFLIFKEVPALYHDDEMIPPLFIMQAFLRGIFPRERIYDPADSDHYLMYQSHYYGAYVLLNAPELFETDPDADHLDDLCMPDEYVDNDFALLKERRSQVGLGDPVVLAIANDDVDALGVQWALPDFRLDWLYDVDTVLDVTIKFNAIRCFKFCLLNGADRANAMVTAIGANREEMIAVLEQEGLGFQRAIETAGLRFRFKILDWLLATRRGEVDKITYHGAICGNNMDAVRTMKAAGIPQTADDVGTAFKNRRTSQAILEEFVTVDPDAAMAVIVPLLYDDSSRFWLAFKHGGHPPPIDVIHEYNPQGRQLYQSLMEELTQQAS